MQAETVLAIGNEALALLGAQVVTQPDEGTDLARLLFRVAPTTLRACLGAHPWRCTMAQLQLAPLSAPPEHSFRRRFALPPGLLAFRRALASASPGAPPLHDWKIVGEELHTDAEQVWAEVQAVPPLARWPAPLVAFARAALAAELALPVTGSNSDAELWQARTYGPPSALGQGGLFALARRADAQSQPAEQMRDFPLLDARRGRVA